jgi:pimeloyl-ACP methyl ester carboxylesterase
MLVGLLDALDLEAVTLLAHDSGGVIASALAAEHPERVARVVLSDTEVPGHVVWAAMAMQWVLGLPGAIHLFEAALRSRRFLRSRLAFGGTIFDHDAFDLDELIATTLGPLRSSRARRLVSLRFMAQYDAKFIDDIAHDRLTMPTLLVWGDRDAIFPLRWARELYERIPEPKDLVVIPNCGVLPHEERPVQWVAAVERFLAASA